MKKYIFLLVLLIIGNLNAGWMNVDSLNVKQKLRNKMYDTDALLYFRSADSLMDTSNVYYKSGLIGIGKDDPGRILDVNGGIIANGDLPIYIQPDDNTSTGSNVYFASDVGLGSSKLVKFGSYADPWSYGNFIFMTKDSSIDVGTDPTPFVYDTAMSIYSNGHVIIGDTANSILPYEFSIFRTTYIDDYLYVNDTTDFASFVTFNNNVHIVDTLSVDDSIYLNGSQHIAGNLTVDGTFDYNGDINLGNITGDSLYVAGTEICGTGNINLNTNYIGYDCSDGGLNFTSSNNAYFTEKVGIGTNSAQTALHVYDGAGGGGTLISDQVTIENSGNTVTNMVSGNTGSNYILFSDSIRNMGGLQYDHPNNRLSFRTNNANRMYLDSNGYLGIGTNSPDGLVHIHSGSAGTISANINGDELTIEGSGNTGLSILSPDVNSSILYFGSPSDNIGSAFQWNYSGNLFTITTSTDSAELRIRSGNNIEAMRIDNYQNIGIGTTTPADKLEVNGTTNTDSLFVSGDSYLSGNVGIGTASPSSILTIQSANPELRIKSNDLTGIGQLNLYSQQAGDVYPMMGLYYNDNTNKGDFRFNGNGVQFVENASGTLDTQMVITGAGNIGIGTSSPSALLNVNGVSRFDDSAVVNGYLDCNDDILVSPTKFIGYDGNAGIQVKSDNTVTMVGGATDNGDITPNLGLISTTNYSTGIGPGIGFIGKTNATPDYAYFAGIKGVKANSTSSDSSGMIEFQTNLNGTGNSTQMVLDENGYLGLNTLAPEGKIHILKAEATVGTHTDYDELIIEGTGRVGMSFQIPDTDTAGIVFSTADYNQQATIDYLAPLKILRFETWENGQMNFYTGYGTLNFQIRKSGECIVGDPTRTDSSNGTLNAEAVYDDGTLLTKYALDYFNDKNFNKKNYPNEKEAVERFLKYAKTVKNIDKYNEFIKEKGSLPSFYDIEKKGVRPSIGTLGQRCWEELEIKSEHIRQLKETIDSQEQRIARLEKLIEENNK